MSGVRNSMNLNIAPQVSSFEFKPAWRITAKTGKILTSVGPERDKIESQFCAVPEMFFSDNLLELSYSLKDNSAGLYFSAFEALKTVKNQPPSNIKVSTAEAWLNSRQQQISDLMSTNSFNSSQHKGFDWTFDSDYRGTLFCKNKANITTEETTEDLDWSNLQRRDEPILFSASVPFYEDELADSGCAQLLGRIRVMPSGFFLLLRYFLRVDGVKFLSHETRVRFRLDSNVESAPSKLSFLRTFVTKESSYSSVNAKLGAHGSVLDVDQVAAVLEPRFEVREKIHINIDI